MKNRFKNFKNRINWKQVVATVVCVALVAALAVTGISIFNKKEKDKDGYIGADLNFSIGGLNEDGTYKKTDGSLYTKDAIEASKVKVTLEFDSTVQYQLFFYDEFDEFISSGIQLGKGSESELPEGATHFRVVLTPVWDADVELDDQVVTLFNKGNYTKQITVSIIEPDNTTEAE